MRVQRTATPFDQSLPLRPPNTDRFTTTLSIQTYTACTRQAIMDTMGASDYLPRVRVTFPDFLPDPHDADHLRRALTLSADRISFDGDQVVLFLADIEVQRFPITMVTGITIDTPGQNGRGQDLAEVRGRYPNAYTPWSQEDESRLVALYQSGERDYVALGREFGRQPSAIRSRLERIAIDRL